MNPIQAKVIECAAYADWLENPYLEQLKKGRELACELLTHSDATARLGAVGSFLFLWHTDDAVAGSLTDLASKDENAIVRYTAASLLMSLHLRACQADRLVLERALITVTSQDSQLPEIVEDVGGYLSCMGTALFQTELR